MIDPELLPEFVAEAGEHLDEMEANLIKLEADPENREILNDIFRDVHTIKGSSAYLGLKVTSELAHKLENLLEMVRQGKRSADSALIDTLIAAKDRIASLVADIESCQEERTETDDLMEAIQRCSSDPGAKGKKAKVDHPQPDTLSGNSQGSALSFSEEDLKLNLEDIFDIEENQRSGPVDTIESEKDFSMDPGPMQAEPASQGAFGANEFVGPEVEESYEETGDEELFAIYLEQLKTNISAIRELATQISASENRTQLLSDINKKIDRLKGSANYMGYDKLVGLCERWQEKLETFQDRLFLNDAPSCGVLIEEGVNAYLEAIQRYFPKLKDIMPVPVGVEVLEPATSQHPSSPTSDVRGQDDDVLSFSEEDFKLDLEGVFDSEENQGNGPADTIASRNDLSPTPSSLQAGPALQGALADDEPVESEVEESYEETGDEELFAIYLEQLTTNLSAIRELAAQIPASDNRSELLSAINKKVERLMASANYMGYDKLVGLCERWEAKLETFQDRLFLNDALSVGVLIEEGVNTYFDTIQRYFPQLKEISPIPVDGGASEPFVCLPQSSPTGSVRGQDEPRRIEQAPFQAENEYEENIDTELFSIFLEQLKDNLQAVQTLGQQFATSENPPEIFNALTEKITRIRAAANYMGYEKLTELYDQWLGELDAFRDPSSGLAEGVDISKRINGCIRTYTDRVFKIFPQIDETEPAPVDEREMSAEEPLPSAPPSSRNETAGHGLLENSLLVDRTGELFSSDDTLEEDEKDLYEAPEISGDEATDKDRVLIDRLSAALDNALGAGVAERGGEEFSELENIGAKVEPENNKEDAPPLIQDQGEARPTLFESPKPSEPVQTEEAAGPAGSDEENEAVPEQVERRREERRKEDRRAATEAGTDKVLRQSLRIDAGKIDELMNQAGELVINRAWFSQLFNELRRLELHLQNIPELDKRDVKQVKSFSFKFHEAIVALGRVANELQEGVMKVRMLPISQLFNRYPRLIRDLVHDSDKDIQLVLRGADTELDKMIIEEIADPMIHVIRNAVDHGIEPASARRAMGKPEKGLLKLDAYHEGSHVVIEVTDDGRGINLEAIKATALKKGLVNEDQLSRMSPKEMTELIMRPGFSTAAQITRTSGRGVGMDVVRKNLENLNGTIEIDSQPGKGTSIRIKIPLTLAVIKALLVKVCGSLFTIPLITVDETLQVHLKEIHTIKGNEVIYLRDSTIPLIRLSALFNLPRRPAQGFDEEKTFVVIVSAGTSRVGLVVDELRGQEEVVIKPLPDYLRDNRGFSGATILGDGGISLILDVHELVNLTIGRQSRRLSESSRMLSEIM